MRMNSCVRNVPVYRTVYNSLLILQIEQVSQLAALVQAQLEYHSRSVEILTQLTGKMEIRSVLVITRGLWSKCMLA